MTSSIGLFGKKFFTNKDNNQLNDKAQAAAEADSKNDKSSISQSDLEAEIDKFFASNDLLSKQLDDLIKLDDKQPSAARKSDSNRLIDFLSLTKHKNKPKQPQNQKPKPKSSNEKPIPKPKVKQQKIKEEEEEKEEKGEAEAEEEENEEEVEEEKAKAEKEKEPNDFIKELETLNEELDIGEKLLNSKEGGPIALNKSTISETLAELIIDSPNQQSGQSAHLSSGKSVISANAQRQDIGNVETHHQNNSTVFVGLGVSVAIVALIINAAMCYSCHNKSEALQRYKDNIMRKRSNFNISMPNNIGSLKFSELKETLSDLPAKLRDFVYVKMGGKKNTIKSNNNNTIDEMYDDSSYTYGPNYNGYGNMSFASTISRTSMNEPVIYNSGAESEYNASILSDSCSVAPPPPPPPPPTYQSKKQKKNQPDENAYHNNNNNKSNQINEYSDEDEQGSKQKNHSSKKTNQKISYTKNTNKLKYENNMRI